MIWEIKSPEENIDAVFHEGGKNVSGLRERKKEHKVQGEWAAELSEPCAGRCCADVMKRKRCFESARPQARTIAFILGTHFSLVTS